jgi:hypothetical protein
MRRSAAQLLCRASFVLVLLLVFAAPAAAGDRIYNIVPPGQFGGLPFNSHSTDQIPLYEGLAPFHEHISASTIASHFKPETLGPIGATTTEATGRPGLTIVRDSFGVPHITGKTRDDVSFGAGFVAAVDRGLLLQLGRKASRVAVAFVPGVDAFGLVTDPSKSYTPSAQAEALVTSEQQQIIRAYGAKGRSILHDLQVYADGVTAGFASRGTNIKWTVNDTIAITAFIGSIFGNGGGGEVANARVLALFESRLGKKAGLAGWRDVMEGNDPEAPTTISKPFPYGNPGRGPSQASRSVDAASVEPTANPTAHRVASNFQVLGSRRSATHRPLLVGGPQLGYFYPEIVYEASLNGPGIHARGALVPGGSPYVLIGRTRNYAWSLTSATNDDIDSFLMRYCGDRNHYVYKGRCRVMGDFYAGTLNGKPLEFKTTVHGPVFGTVRSHGLLYAISKQRSTYGQDGNSLAALRDMTLDRGRTVSGFYHSANEFGFTFNWAYASRQHIAYFSAGKLPHRAKGVDPLLPTIGSGRYDWKGFLTAGQHPHQADPPSGAFLQWNNKPAPKWTQGDDNQSYGSVQRVELFRGYGPRPTLERAVGVMNRASTQDLRIEQVWPVIHAVLRHHSAPSRLTRQAIDLLDGWKGHGGSRIDSGLNGTIDDPGAAVMDHAFERLSTAVMGGRLDPTLVEAIRSVQPQDQAPYGATRNGSSFADGWYEYVDKDLRTLMTPRKVRGKFHLRYCGRGNRARCRAALFGALRAAANELASQQGNDPSKWRSDATLDRISFQPGLLPNTMRWVNRPTFQQVISFGATP